MDSDETPLVGRWVTPRQHKQRAKQHFFTETEIARYMTARETITKFGTRAVVRPICKHKITRIHFLDEGEPLGDNVCYACMDAYNKLTKC